MYALTITNDSQMDTTFVIFQKPPAQNDDLSSLAWMARRIMPRMSTQFNWQKNYSFVAAGVGNVVPGVVVMPITTVPANPTQENEATLEPNMVFNNMGYDGQPDVFRILVSGGVAPSTSGVGIALSGMSLFIAPAIPNLAVEIPVPNDQYYVSYGNYQQGEVLDFERLSQNAALVDFSHGQGTRHVTLEANGTFIVQ